MKLLASAGHELEVEFLRFYCIPIASYQCLKKNQNIIFSKTCVKRPLSKRQKIGFQDRLSLNAGQKYCRMLHRGAFCYTFGLH